MINISNQGRVFIQDNFLHEEISSNTMIDKGLRSWDLSQIASILTTSSIEDAEARNAAIRNARRRRMMQGALGGGLVDAAMGDGDSIIDGVLLGAAFGYISSKGTETPTACVGIVFLDGEYLSLRVEAHEYTQLQAAAAAAMVTQGDAAEVRPSLSWRPLTRGACNNVLESRARNEAVNGGIPIIMSGGLSMFLAVMAQGFVPLIFENAPDVLAAGARYVFYAMGAIGFMITAMGFIRTVRPRSIQSFLRSDAEKATYKGHFV